MIRVASLAVVAASLCGLSRGQTSAVIPPANTTVEGNGLDMEPFGFNQITHLQYVDQSLLTAVPNGALINRVAYRRDWGSTPTATLQRLLRGLPTSAIWEIWMVNYVGPVLNPTNVITRTGWSNVMTPILVNFPDLPRGPGPTANFDLSFALDRPLAYTGGALGLSHVAYEASANTFATYVFDAVTSTIATGTVSRISPTALGCPVDENRCEGSAPNPGAGNLEFFLYGGKPLSPAVAYFGAGTSSWMGTQLPLNLGFLGIGACSVYTDLTVPLPMMTNIAGLAAARAVVPGDASLTNASLYGQWLLVDDRVNPAVNLATSDGLTFRLGPTVGGYATPMSVVSAAQNLARGRTGYVNPGTGLVFQLSW